MSEDDAHRSNFDDRSVRAFAVKLRAFGAAAMRRWSLTARRGRANRVAVLPLPLYNAPAMTAHVRRTMSDRSSADFLSAVLVLLSQKVAADLEENHLFGKIHISAMGGWYGSAEIKRW